MRGGAFVGLVGGLGVWTAGLAQTRGPSGLGHLVYVEKARARMSGPVRPYKTPCVQRQRM
jgi:hypothetical protein